MRRTFRHREPSGVSRSILMSMIALTLSVACSESTPPPPRPVTPMIRIESRFQMREEEWAIAAITYDGNGPSWVWLSRRAEAPVGSVAPFFRTYSSESGWQKIATNEQQAQAVELSEMHLSSRQSALLRGLVPTDKAFLLAPYGHADSVQVGTLYRIGNVGGADTLWSETAAVADIEDRGMIVPPQAIERPSKHSLIAGPNLDRVLGEMIYFVLADSEFTYSATTGARLAAAKRFNTPGYGQ